MGPRKRPLRMLSNGCAAHMLRQLPRSQTSLRTCLTKSWRGYPCQHLWHLLRLRVIPPSGQPPAKLAKVGGEAEAEAGGEEGLGVGEGANPTDWASSRPKMSLSHRPLWARNRHTHTGAESGRSDFQGLRIVMVTVTPAQTWHPWPLSQTLGPFRPKAIRTGHPPGSHLPRP